MKRFRQARIVELVRDREIETQEELARLLLEDGFNVTQATVSRDIRQLKLFKVPNGDGRQKYALLDETGGQTPPFEHVNGLFRDGVRSIEHSGNIILLKTGAGMAPGVAACVDALRPPEILGSVAGDDTLLCVVREGADAAAVAARFRSIIG
ncbi:MAG: arginine repressor [Clostridiales bacterium]|jgi:transcriptional regulator of arginine metabolism|nr:arginine repressor [Clostridiales bacterium]